MSLKFKYSRNQIYWLCQISGWTMLFLVNLFFTMTYQTVNFNHIYAFSYLSLLGLVFTHFDRGYIIRYELVKRPIKQILPRILFGSLMLSVMMTILFLITTRLFHLNHSKTIGADIFVNNLFNIWMILGIWYLIYFAIHYFEGYNKAEIERFKWEAAVKDFELKTLKSQLNPHFMFNALNSIRALVEENPERAQETITQLSNIFRYSLRIEKTEKVPLEDEIRIVRDYLALEKVRYEERLNYSITVDSDANRIEIPPMMIQTLVENGIKHGIAKLHDGGTVSIKASVDDTKLTIQIINSGSFSDSDLQKTTGFGVSNTKQRLQIIYGPSAGFKIYEENQNVIVLITIPF
jgi:two-component system, LytTR family, sensor kinase